MALAPIYVNRHRLDVGDNATPSVEEIVRAAGEDPQKVRVRLLRTADDESGRALALQDVIPRDESAGPVRLRLLKPTNTDVLPHAPLPILKSKTPTPRAQRFPPPRKVPQGLRKVTTRVAVVEHPSDRL